MANAVQNPYDMDSTTFDAEKYLEKLLKVSISQFIIVPAMFSH